MARLNLKNLLKQDKVISRVAGLAQETPFILEALFQAANTSQDLSYVRDVATVAQEFRKEDTLEVAVLATRDMVLSAKEMRNDSWNVSEGRDIYHDWVDDVVQLFVQNRELPVYVRGLAQYSHNEHLSPWERKDIARKLANPKLAAIAKVLESQPVQDAANFMDFAFHGLERNVDFTTPLLRMAREYIPVTSAVKAFIDYTREEVERTCYQWGDSYVGFIVALAKKEIFNVARQYSGNVTALKTLFKGVDRARWEEDEWSTKKREDVKIRARAREYRRERRERKGVPDSYFNAFEHQTYAAEAAINDRKLRKNATHLFALIARLTTPYILDLTVKKIEEQRMDCKEVDIGSVAQLHGRKDVRAALAQNQERKEALAVMVNYLIESTITGTRADAARLSRTYTDPLVLSCSDAIVNPKDKTRYVATVSEVVYKTNELSLAPSIANTVRDAISRSIKLDDILETIKAAADCHGKVGVVRETLNVVRNYRDAPALLYLVLDKIGDCIDGAVGREPEKTTYLARLYNIKSVHDTLVAIGPSEAKLKELTWTLDYVAKYSKTRYSNQTIDRMTTTAAKLADDTKKYKLFNVALRTIISEVSGARAMDKFLTFVDKNHDSPQLNNALTYITDQVSENRRTISPSAFVSMVQSYPIPKG